MRFKFIFSILAFFLLQICSTTATKAQTISMNKTNASLFDIFQEIKAQTGYDFVYKSDAIKDLKLGNIAFHRATLSAVLDTCLKHQPLTYTIQNKTVIIQPITSREMSFNFELSGHVAKENGEALIGATITMQPSGKQYTTDNEGNFLVPEAKAGDILVVSFMGFLKQVVNIRGPKELDIILKEVSRYLTDVSVVGYGTQKKATVTSSISSFIPTEFNTRPVLGPDQMIQGKMAGVMVASSSGTPGSANRVSIRGIGSLSASNEPLYVIDGIPVRSHNAALYNMGESMNPLAELNPNDIESVSVLKDAASAAIYGSRATNGVILITTKSGKSGKSKLSFDAYSGFQQVPSLNKLKMAGSDLYVDVINEGIENYNQQYGYTSTEKDFIPDIANPYPGLPDVNWLDLVLRTAYRQSMNLAVSGGTDKGTYYISGSYLDQQGAVETNRLKKYTGKINLTQKVFSWLKLGANTNFSFSHNNRVPGSNLGSAVLARGIEQRPFDRPYKPNGEYYVGGTSELLRHNVVQILNEEDVYLKTHRLLGNIYADVNIMKNLVFRSSLGTDIIYSHDYVYYNENHPYGKGTGRLVDNTRLISNLVTENTFNYKQKIGDIDASLLAGHSFQKVNTSTNLVDGNGFPSPSFDVNSVAASILDASTGLSENALESYFSRANIAYKGKYLLTLSLRADGSSRFSPKHRFGYFPSVSAGWDLSKERFWGAGNTSLKLRLSYGETGNQEGIGNYAYQALTGGGANYNNNSGISITNPGNADLTWESANQFDVGIDLGLDGGRFNITADYFVKNTENLLYDQPTMATSGFTSITTNIGSMRNNGIELGINTYYKWGALEWNSAFNISLIRNKLVSLIGDEPLLIGANRVLAIGEQVGSFYIYKQLGIFQNNDEVPKGLYESGVRAGDVKYEDVDNNGVIDVKDRQIVGTSNPDFFGGWNNSFKLNNFDFNFSVTYTYGSEVYAPWRINVSRLGGTYFPFLESEALNRWKGPGTSNSVPRAISGNTYNTYNSTRFLEDGSYIRLRNVSIGYSLPEQLLSLLRLKRLRIYAQADNLFLMTNYSGLDPEVSDNLNPKYLGDDNLVLPQLRSFNFGINLTL